METYFEIELKDWKDINIIREKCFEKYGAPIDCRHHTDYKTHWFRTDQKRFAEVAKEITGLDWTVKEYPKSKEQLETEKGFTYGT